MIRGQRLPFANDYLPVTMVLAKQKEPSFQYLQTDAEYVAGCKAGASLHFFHVPGTCLILLLMASPGS